MAMLFKSLELREKQQSQKFLIGKVCTSCLFEYITSYILHTLVVSVLAIAGVTDNKNKKRFS